MGLLIDRASEAYTQRSSSRRHLCTWPGCYAVLEDEAQPLKHIGIIHEMRMWVCLSRSGMLAQRCPLRRRQDTLGTNSQQGDGGSRKPQLSIFALRIVDEFCCSLNPRYDSVCGSVRGEPFRCSDLSILHKAQSLSTPTFISSTQRTILSQSLKICIRIRPEVIRHLRRQPFFSPYHHGICVISTRLFRP